MASLITPQRAALVNCAPTAGDSSLEIKFNEYRLLAQVSNGVFFYAQSP
jgi:hypothetical protein